MLAAGIDGGRQRRWAGIDVTPVANDGILARMVVAHCAMGLEGPSSATDGSAAARERWWAGIEVAPVAAVANDRIATRGWFTARDRLRRSVCGV